VRKRVASLSAMRENLTYPITVDEEDIVLVRQGATVYALHDQCSHADFPLSLGLITPGKIKCKAHGAEFDLATGKALCAPAYTAVQAYATEIDGDDVFLVLE
jgi:3-phenylpropionate/trans-cinnamate dioxygenase ferredoxin component